MTRLKLQICTLFLLFILLYSGITVGVLSQKTDVARNIDEQISYTEDEISDDFFFIHMTDTHLLHRIIDRQENSKKRLTAVLDYITSFEKQPAFIVITGDLVEWGSGVLGAFNYRALIECFHEKDNQYYADVDHSIPVYFTPGNHDYYFISITKLFHSFGIISL